MNERAFFIDRDGVINQMVKYGMEWDSPQSVDDIRLVEGIAVVLEWLNSHGILTVEVSNQTGVVKGKMNWETSNAIEKGIHELLAQQGVRVEYRYICVHHPKGVVAELTRVCECRKPKPGLLLQAARELGINLGKSLFLGDSAVDVEAGKSAGVKTIIYSHRDNEPVKLDAAKLADADFRVESLTKVLPIVKRVFK